MRVVWWSAAALALLAVTSALRTTQVEGARYSRRLPASAPSAPSASENSVTNPAETQQRSRGTRRREEVITRDVRTRTRSRPVETTSEIPQPVDTQSGNERFDSRRTLTRSRSRPVEEKTEITPRENVVRSRSRSNRRPTTSITPTSSTTSTYEVTTPTIDESKIEVINTNLNDISKIPPTQETATTQVRRRSSVTVAQTTESVAPRKDVRRGRINTRGNTKASDLDASGTTFSISYADKEPTTARTNDLRNSRKLRYRQRQPETDSNTNLTGEGFNAINEVKSSQDKGIVSQVEAQVAPKEVLISQSTERSKVKMTTIKVTKVVRRPIGKEKANLRQAAPLPKAKGTEEINEDDNYPESFKALIQAKNTSTQADSPTSESLTLKETQKVYKTYNTASSQSIQTGPATNKFSRLRKQKAEEGKTEVIKKNDNKPIEVTLAPEVTIVKISEYKLRGTYGPRNKKSTVFTSTTEALSMDQDNEKPQKFTRKFKLSTTTELPKSEGEIQSKRAEPNSVFKKPLNRSSFTRKYPIKSTTSTEISVVTEAVTSKSTLPKTSYYSRLRNFRNTASSKTISTTESFQEIIQDTVQKKTEDPVDSPLIFTLIGNPDTTYNKVNNVKNNQLIRNKNYNSKESSENTVNEFSDMAEESENISVINALPTILSRMDSDKYKYHSNYKDVNPTNAEVTERSSTATPLVRNLKTRKYSRKRVKARLNDTEATTPQARERNIKKISEAFSKTTEPTSNGITSEPDKSKSRFSSKYRASSNDKPFYKPTVPTITPSTAWLKFYVTDHLLTKSVEEPYSFDGEDIDVTTRPMPKVVAMSSYIRNTSYQPVEGEEIQLGPDVNAISFTQTQRPLSSADLRLSESLVKPSHVMNVEASHHSPSVTVSIFDALAEILTSTPRTRLSTTTEVTKLPLNTDVTKIIDGVSNVNVNNAAGVPSQDTFNVNNTFMLTSADVSTITKSVQNADQTTPTVINSSIGSSVTLSLNNQDGNVTPVNTPQTPAPATSPVSTPTPIPTTRISARRPFAFKVLYSDTESPTDISTTAPELSTIQPTTDSTTVYNTVSDLLLSNNNLVSSELTSMLSNNIKNIIRNMDDDSKSRISGDMAKLLKELVPRALDRLGTMMEGIDSIPNTTPYSLEDIKDTENIDINTESVNIDDLKNVDLGNDVNSTVDSSSSQISPKEVPAQAVNNSSSGFTLGVTESAPAVSSSQTTSASIPLNFNVVTAQVSSSTAATTTTTASTSSVSSDTAFNFVNNEDNLGNRFGTVIMESTNKKSPLPFLTNYQINDFTVSEKSSNPATVQITPVTKSLPVIPTPSLLSLQNMEDVDYQDPSQISRLQLWVLSKKARVLKMIEDLIRQHNNELATASPLTDLISPTEKNNLSERLTDVMNMMTSSNSPETNTVDVTVPFITSPTTTVPTTKLVSSQEVTSSASTIVDLFARGLTETVATTNDPLTTISAVNVSSRIAVEETASQTSVETTVSATSTPSEAITTDTNTIPTPPIAQTEAVNDIPSTTLTVTTQRNSEVLTRSEGDIPSTTDITETIQTTTQSNTETTTVITNIETTTQLNIETTTNSGLDITTQDIKTTTPLIEAIETSSIKFSTATPALPKKDFVIFGILPNNTVVRKNPNDDELEQLTEATPYIIYGVLPNNTIIRKFPNGTRVPRVMQKIDILPISPWSLRNPYSPIHNNPAIVRPQSNPIRVSTNTVISTDTSNNGSLTNDTVNNQQNMISSALNIKSSSLGITTATKKSSAEKSTASHVLSLRTTTMLPSIDEILLNSISSAAKQEMVITSMMSSTREPIILTLDIDPEQFQKLTRALNGQSVNLKSSVSNVLVKTQQIRTERPDGSNEAIFKFIPIDEVTVTPQNSNILKLASSKQPSTNTGKPEVQTAITPIITESNAQTPQIQTRVNTNDPATTVQVSAGTPMESTTVTITPIATTVSAPTITTDEVITTTSTTTTTSKTPMTTTTVFTTTTTTPELTTTSTTTTTAAPTTTSTVTPTTTTTTTVAPTTSITTSAVPSTITTQITESLKTNSPQSTTNSIEEDIKQYQKDIELLQTLLLATGRDPKSLNLLNNPNILSIATTRVPTTSAPTSSAPTSSAPTSSAPTTSASTTNAPTTNAPTTSAPTTRLPFTSQPIDQAKLLQTLLNAGQSLTTTPGTSGTSQRSIEDDIRQFEEDTKLLKALLAVTGQNPDNFNIPSLDIIRTTTERATFTTLNIPTTTQMLITTQTPVTTQTPTTTSRPTTTQSLDSDLKQFQEDAKLLQALLQATGQNTGNVPIISGVTSNVRIASNPQTTSIGSNPTTPINIRPVYTTTQQPVFKTFAPRTISTLQPAVTEDIGISTTFSPFNSRQPTATARAQASTTVFTASRVPNVGFTSTTEIPSTSTFSVQEDLAFLQNLKSVLSTNPQNQDPEAALANRIIALAVEKSLNEIQNGTQTNSVRTGKNINNGVNNLISTTFTPVTTTTPTTTTITTTTTPRPTTTQRPTTTLSGPSIEDDIRQFEEDTKLLQALIKATGQDPSKFNIPTLPSIPGITTTQSTNVSPLPDSVNEDLKILSNLLASPSPLNEPFDPLTPNVNYNIKEQITNPTVVPSGAKIVVKDEFKSVQDDGKLLQTLIKLQGVQETTTIRSKLAITGQSSDEALQKLIQQQQLQQQQQGGMMSESTQAPVSLSTEYGKSNDALLAALLKEQGFGPTTASSLDEQLRLAALLNQVVVTPKARRTTTQPPPPPPPAQRRPILDGLAWLWQQWRETGPATSRPRRPASPSPTRPSPSAAPVSGSRVNWFGSGPFVGNADDRPTANRIPLEPPRAVTAEQSPGRGQLVSAAINVTRAFSQFLGAAIQGAAQTVQSVIRAGQRAATDVYNNGSGGSR